VFAIVPLTESGYFQPVLVWQMLQNPAIAVLLIATSAVLAWRWKDLRWSQFENGLPARIVIVTAVFVLAWSFSTYDYNLYYNQPHWVDRILLIALAVGVAVHPGFAPSFTIVAILIASQFNMPVDVFGWADKRVIFELLIVFSVWLFGRLIIGWRNMRSILFLVIAVILTNYLYAGAQKLAIGWEFNENLTYLMASSYVNGWLAIIAEPAALQILDFLARFNPVFIFMTLLIELGVVLFFAHRFAPWPVLIGCITLHLIIFATSGIFFWKWLAVDAGILIGLRALSPDAYRRFFGWRMVAASVVVFVAAKFFLHPTRFGWYDTPLTIVYKFDAVGESGKTYEIDNDFMAPYDLIFSQNRFYYLSDQPVLVGTFGQVGSTEQLNRILSVNPNNLSAGITELSNQYGRHRINESGRQRFDQFIRTYFGNLNAGVSKTLFINTIRAPLHISNFPASEPYRMQEKVKRIIVRQVTAY